MPNQRNQNSPQYNSGRGIIRTRASPRRGKTSATGWPNRYSNQAILFPLLLLLLWDIYSLSFGVFFRSSTVATLPSRRSLQHATQNIRGRGGAGLNKPHLTRTHARVKPKKACVVLHRYRTSFRLSSSAQNQKKNARGSRYKAIWRLSSAPTVRPTHLDLPTHGERDVRAVGEGRREAVELGCVVSRGVGAPGAAAREGPRERPRGVRHPVPDDLSQGLVEALREERVGGENRRRCRRTRVVEAAGAEAATGRGVVGVAVLNRERRGTTYHFCACT